MVKDDDQKSSDSGVVDGKADGGTENVPEDADKVVEKSELEHDENAEGEETHEDEEEKTADELRALQNELDKITVSVPTLYVVLVMFDVLRKSKFRLHIVDMWCDF